MIRLRSVLPAAVLALILSASACAAPAAPPAPGAPAATRELLRRLRAAGRAEAALEMRRIDPQGGPAVTSGGRLALEPPSFARLDLDDGQSLTLRPDGGDWLQPATKQLVRAGAESAAGFLSWWGALLDPAGLAERRLGPRRFALTRPGSGLEQVVELGADGLPRRISVATGGTERIEYTIRRWRFVRPRGAAAFTLGPPRGFEVVEMP